MFPGLKQFAFVQSSLRAIAQAIAPIALKLTFKIAGEFGKRYLRAPPTVFAFVEQCINLSFWG